MLKESAVESMGGQGLLLPSRVKAALAANDRIKLHLSVVQAAAQHADRPKSATIDLAREQEVAGVKEPWIAEMIASAAHSGDAYFLPGLPILCKALADDLETMAKPLLQMGDGSALQSRYAQWLEWLRAVQDDTFSASDITLLEHGDRDHGDSVHILVMDLHKQLNRLAASLASEDIDGAHVWNLEDDDRPRVRAFMRGIHRTVRLKFDHPGLDTAATRDGKRLILQNDIGTNDAHVLVMQVEGRRISLTYSDLHGSRFEFFQNMLGTIGAVWSVVEPRVTPGLNAGQAYVVGTANFDSDTDESLENALEEIGARIVFLIDWNRARKRLQQFTSKTGAVEVLKEVAAAEAGHMGWLKAGGERLLYRAMQAAGDGVFRLGDRLDTVLGEAAARQFLVEAICLASKALLKGQPVALAEDEIRVLLSRHLQDWAREFDMAAEHAAYCHELAMAVRDALAHGSHRSETSKLLVRAKGWERRADELVNQAREAALRHPRWQKFAHLIERADDIADFIEEAAYLIDVIVEDHDAGLKGEVRHMIAELAGSVLNATEDYVKALTIARTLAHAMDTSASNAFLDATWRVVLAERNCDEQLRAARRLILKEITQPGQIMLATDLANSLERASDALMAASYILRDAVLARTEAAL